MPEAPFKRIDVFMTVMSQYNLLHHFSRKLYEAIKRTGINCRLLAFDELSRKLAEDPPELTIAFNGVPEVEGHQFLCEVLKIPHLAILVDPPHCGAVYVIKCPYVMLGCDDQYCCTFLEGFNFHRNIFIPHAVEMELKPDPAIEKIYDVVLLGTYDDYEAEKAPWNSLYPAPIVKLMEETAEKALQDPHLSFINIFIADFHNIVREHSLENLSSVKLFDALETLEKYIKGRDRALLIKGLKDVPVHIFSNTTQKTTWSTYLGDGYPHIHLHDAVNYEEAIEIMKRSKIMLNPQVKNRYGAHERFFTGTACGALVISSESQYLRSQFIENEEIVFYKHSHLDELNSVIKHYLAHDEERNLIVEKARDKVMKHHTWDARLKTLLPRLAEIVEEMKWFTT
jgi:spore maturation protein CgeB